MIPANQFTRTAREAPGFSRGEDVNIRRGALFCSKEQWLEMVTNFERGSLPKIALTNTQNKEQSK